MNSAGILFEIGLSLQEGTFVNKSFLKHTLMVL